MNHVQKIHCVHYVHCGHLYIASVCTCTSTIGLLWANVRCGQMYILGTRTLQANVYFGPYTNLHVLWVSENGFTIRICIPSFFFQPKRSFRCYCFYPTRYFTEIIIII